MNEGRDRVLYTNAHAIRAGLMPCETNPVNGGLSRTVHQFHAVAAVTTGSQKGNKRHVCRDCAHKFHNAQHQVQRIVWD